MRPHPPSWESDKRRLVVSSKDHLSQAAFDNRAMSDEDKFYAEREKELIADLRQSRVSRQSSERVCPNAACEGAVLQCLMHNDVEIDRCPKCQGIWLDAGELELLIERAKSAPRGLMRFFHHLAGDYNV